MSKVLIAQKIPKKAADILKGMAEVVFSGEGDIEGFEDLLKSATAVILGSSIKFTHNLMDKALNLKVISRTGAGVDNVDIEAATKKGIMVLNTPEANSVTVAEHTIALILAISKQLLYLDSELRKGNFKTVRRLYLPVDINGKTLGLIGCGRIARLVAKKCINTFGMKIIGYDPYIDPKLDGIEMVKEIEEIFKESDFISLHIPFNDSTKGLVSKSLLSLMKPAAYLINTARGGLVDEEALYEKLRNKEISGAAFDVFKPEPPEATNKLLKLSNIILTPHSAALTKECTVRVAVEAATGVLDYLKGKTPKFVFNKEVLS
ncbi:Glyoxylate/hydroxypyruvate reductase B [subsurface metagenome]